MFRTAGILFTSLTLTTACNNPTKLTAKNENPFTSDMATLMTFDFAGELLTATPANPKGQIRAQLLYSVNHLNSISNMARLDRALLTDITSTYTGNDLTKISYRAK